MMIFKTSNASATVCEEGFNVILYLNIICDHTVLSQFINISVEEVALTYFSYSGQLGKRLITVQFGLLISLNYAVAVETGGAGGKAFGWVWGHHPCAIPSYSAGWMDDPSLLYLYIRKWLSHLSLSS